MNKLTIATSNPYRRSIQEMYPGDKVIVHILARFPMYSRYVVYYNDGSPTKHRCWELHKKDDRP